jgi:hypothetical protein
MASQPWNLKSKPKHDDLHVIKRGTQKVPRFIYLVRFFLAGFSG